MLVRAFLAVVLAAGLWAATETTAKADPAVEFLMVPSGAMGRDIPVAFMAGGPHAVYLLDAFNAAPDVSNWVTAGNAMNTLAGKGISVAAPAGGAWSLYTNWEQDGSRQWETFLSSELPDWLAANKGLAPGGHGIVGAAQGGTGALMMAAFHPDRFRYAGSMSGFLTPSATTLNGAITAGMAQYGGVDTRNMWGLPQLGRWKWHDPDVHAQLMVDNNTRLWVFSPATLTCSDPAAMIGYCDQAQGSNRDVLPALPRHRRPQRPLRLPDGWQPRLGELGPAAGRDVRRSGRRHQVGKSRPVERRCPFGRPVPWRRAAHGTANGLPRSRALLLASAAALLTGCAVPNPLMSAVAPPTSETGAQAGAADVASGGTSLIVTGQQRAYLDALAAAGIRPSDELLALSIGSYVCQARAAKQSDQAVWDFVLPLVRSDVRHGGPSSMTPSAAEVSAATADYIRIATERLC